MRKLKSVFAVLLALSVILLSGCANISALITKNDSVYYELTAISEKADIYASIDIRGDNILFLTAKGIDDYELTLYNAEKNRIVAEKTLSGCPLEYISGAEFHDESTIFVYDDGNGKAVSYDFALNQTGTADYEVWENMGDSSFIDDSFAIYDTYAFSYNADNYYFVFYDNEEKIYVFDGEDETINAVGDGKLFTTESKYSESSNSWETTIYVKDIKNALCINSAHIGSSSFGIFNDVIVSAVSEKYICFVEHIGNEQTGMSKYVPRLWKYTEAPVNEAIEVKAMTEADIVEDNDKIISDIESKYGINVLVNEEPLFGFDVELGASALQVNSVLTSLSAALDLFPENFVQEVYKDAEYVSGFNINIVDNIDGATAFANDFTETYEIVFGYHGFSKSVVFHEFMHLIDNRIQTYYDDNNMDFYAQWWALNPEDFEYGSEEDYDFDDGYFVSYYAMTNVAEDLADTFQAMFEAYENGEDYRFTEYEHVNKKAALICEAIRMAFPCMENADAVIWEKYTELAN